MRWLKNAFSLVKEAFQGWMEDGSLELGAALSYYTAFSLAPLLAIAIAGLVFGRQAVEGQLFAEIRGLVGPASAATIQSMIASAGRRGVGALATGLSVVVILFGASGVFGQLQTSLDRIRHVAPKPDRGVWGFLHDRFLSFGMVLGVGFLLLVSLLMSAAAGSLIVVLLWVYYSAQILFFGAEFPRSGRCAKAARSSPTRTPSASGASR